MVSLLFGKHFCIGNTEENPDSIRGRETFKRICSLNNPDLYLLEEESGNIFVVNRANNLYECGYIKHACESDFMYCGNIECLKEDHVEKENNLYCSLISGRKFAECKIISDKKILMQPLTSDGQKTRDVFANGVYIQEDFLDIPIMVRKNHKTAYMLEDGTICSYRKKAIVNGKNVYIYYGANRLLKDTVSLTVNIHAGHPMDIYESETGRTFWNIVEKVVAEDGEVLGFLLTNPLK